MKKMLAKKGITLISLIVTIIVMLILAGITINLILNENNNLFNIAQEADEENSKQTATEKINLKITNSQMSAYAKSQRMPTLQELANDFCEDNEIQYVSLASKKTASLEKIEVGQNTSIFTKLKDYPYEFEINSSLQLASIDGIKIATNTNPSPSTIELDYANGIDLTSTLNAVNATYLVPSNGYIYVNIQSNTSTQSVFLMAVTDSEGNSLDSITIQERSSSKCSLTDHIIVNKGTILKINYLQQLSQYKITFYPFK